MNKTAILIKHPHRSENLDGDVLLVTPVSWQIFGFSIYVIVSVGAIFISIASYARIETVTGSIAPAAGVASVVPTRSGVIAALPVQEGQQVQAGAELATVRAEEDSASGMTAAERIQAAIAQQDASLVMQSGQVEAAAQAQLRQLAAQREGLAAEAAQLESQLQFQQDLVSSAQKELDRIRPVAERGFISAHDIQQREDTLLTRRQGLAQLQQALSAKRSAIVEAERSAAQVASQGRAQSASLAATRAEVAQQAASVANSRAYVLRAPIAGRVAALTARVGQPTSAQTSLMTIVPTGSELRAELVVPSAAIGFVKPGQDVRLAVDAFPYERFGTVPGKVLTVASSAVNRQTATGTVVPVYVVTVTLGQKSIYGFGRQEPLFSGMTLTARIVTERQSLLAWLFEPLLAVRRR